MHLPQPSWPRTKDAVLNLAQNAATYDALTAVGAVLVEAIGFYVDVAGVDLTSLSVVTNQTNVTTILTTAEGAVASLVIQKNLAFAYSRFPFQLASGQKLRYIIAGNGTAGSVKMSVVYRPVTQGTPASLV